MPELSMARGQGCVSARATGGSEAMTSTPVARYGDRAAGMRDLYGDGGIRRREARPRDKRIDVRASDSQSARQSEPACIDSAGPGGCGLAVAVPLRRTERRAERGARTSRGVL